MRTVITLELWNFFKQPQGNMFSQEIIIMDKNDNILFQKWQVVRLEQKHNVIYK